MTYNVFGGMLNLTLSLSMLQYWTDCPDDDVVYSYTTYVLKETTVCCMLCCSCFAIYHSLE